MARVMAIFFSKRFFVCFSGYVLSVDMLARYFHDSKKVTFAHFMVTAISYFPAKIICFKTHHQRTVILEPGCFSIEDDVALGNKYFFHNFLVNKMIFQQCCMKYFDFTKFLKNNFSISAKLWGMTSFLCSLSSKMKRDKYIKERQVAFNMDYQQMARNGRNLACKRIKVHKYYTNFDF